MNVSRVDARISREYVGGRVGLVREIAVLTHLLVRPALEKLTGRIAVRYRSDAVDSLSEL